MSNGSVGHGPVSIKEVAHRAGVSVGTISNVLNRPDVVAEKTRTRILATIEELGYVRNGSASRLRATHNNALGLVTIDVGNPFFTEVVRGAERVAEELGYVMMLCNSDSLAIREDRHLRFLYEQRVAGILVTPINRTHVLPKLDGLVERGTSVVLVDEASDQDDRCSVVVDDVLGGELAGEHLLSLGRRRIVYVEVTSHFRPFEDRLVGLRRAVAANPTATDASIEVVRLPTLHGHVAAEAIDNILAHEPDAVFCANDIAAIGVLRALLARDIKVPQDIALVGYDDIAFASMAAIPLTSVRQPAFELGQTAARLLIEECSGAPHTHQHVVFQPQLIPRQSTLG